MFNELLCTLSSHRPELFARSEDFPSSPKALDNTRKNRRSTTKNTIMCKPLPLPTVLQKLSFKSWSSFLFVLLVILLISLIPLTLTMFVFWPWLSWYSTWTYWTWTFGFNVGVVLLWYYYFKTMRTNPGVPPREYDPWTTSTQPIVMELKKTSGEARFCRVCQAYKPPRSHHCSTCKTCVLKMDHHCPWVNACVGHANAGHFYRFLFWTTFSTLYACWLVALRLYGQIRYNLKMGEYYRTPFPDAQKINLAQFATPSATGSEVASLIVNSILLVVLIFSVGILFVFQTMYIVRNVTTIESFEKDRLDTMIDRGWIAREDAAHPYRLSRSENWGQVLGSGNLFLGLLFPRIPDGDGMAFRINAHAVKKSFFVERPDGKSVSVFTWPPEQYLNHYGRRDRILTVNSDPTLPSSTEQALSLEALDEGREKVHVRRGSEGFQVREWSDLERDRFVNEEMEREVTVLNEILSKNE